ncbi:MAG: hypothetical protein WAO20_18450 [Acidobacteriota bacterium]|jgi:ribosomal protein L37AE/L43A
MKPTKRARRCPQCGSEQVIRIVYGLPSAALSAQAERYEVHLGGCCIEEESPEWHCRACGHAFRLLSQVELDAVRQ